MPAAWTLAGTSSRRSLRRGSWLFAAKVARDACSITEDDVQRLRDRGLSDRDIFDVAVAAAARCFFSKTLDAFGALPDAEFAELDPGLRDALTVGRPIEQPRP